MEFIEKKDNNANNQLERFRDEIKNLVLQEINTLRKGEYTSVHFITDIQTKETDFKVEDLTEEDMEMYYKIKNKKAELEEFKKYKEKIFSGKENIAKSRQMFAAYLSNLFMIYNFNQGQGK
jgi:hypothetical protein